jgi:hypothetical protein
MAQVNEHLAPTDAKDDVKKPGEKPPVAETGRSDHPPALSARGSCVRSTPHGPQRPAAAGVGNQLERLSPPFIVAGLTVLLGSVVIALLRLL